MSESEQLISDQIKVDSLILDLEKASADSNLSVDVLDELNFILMNNPPVDMIYDDLFVIISNHSANQEEKDKILKILSLHLQGG